MTEFYPPYEMKEKNDKNKSIIYNIKDRYKRFELATSFSMLEPTEKIIAYVILFFLIAILLQHSMTIYALTKNIFEAILKLSISIIKKIK